MPRAVKRNVKKTKLEVLGSRFKANVGAVICPLCRGHPDLVVSRSRPSQHTIIFPPQRKSRSHSHGEKSQKSARLASRFPCDGKKAGLVSNSPGTFTPAGREPSQPPPNGVFQMPAVWNSLQFILLSGRWHPRSSNNVRY